MHQYTERISSPARSQSAASDYASCEEESPGWDWGDAPDPREPSPLHPTSCSDEAGSRQAAAGADQLEGGELLVGEGVAGILGDARLSQHPGRRLQVPLTQQPPQLTEDMLQEREAALAALGKPLQAFQLSSVTAHAFLSHPNALPTATRQRL